MNIERITRAVVFAVFFSIGAAVLSVTVLCNDLLKYYHNRTILQQAEEHLKKLETLGNDYDILLGKLDGDPCELTRLAPAMLGIEPNEPNTVYPHATFDKLSAARIALTEEPNQPQSDQATPLWLNCWCLWPRRHIMFIAGSSLVLISFIFFGPTRKPRRSMTVISKTEPPDIRQQL
ncbi:MAG: hypothetical protein JW749_02460 [Sedimentisphaerales bacterium]|nr:hypothetical protein [Sedimentisphaerales bacterium]